jgi:hypothetical protein
MADIKHGLAARSMNVGKIPCYAISKTRAMLTSMDGAVERRRSMMSTKTRSGMCGSPATYQDGTLAPIFLRLATQRWRRWVLDLDPIVRSPEPIR